jgi:hypothetical protein
MHQIADFSRERARLSADTPFRAIRPLTNHPAFRLLPDDL